MRPVPVLLLCQALTQGGSERQLCETAKHLDPDRFEAHAGCLRPGGIRAAELESRKIPVALFALSSFGGPRLFGALSEMAGYIRRHRIALVHSFDTPMNVVGTAAARMARAAVTLSSQRAFRDLAPFPFRHLLRLTDSMVDGVVVNCRAVEEHMKRDERVPASLLRLCYNGVDTGAFHPGAGPRPEPLASPGLTVGVVCALRPEKGLDTLVRAFARLRHPGPRLAIVGDGPMREPLSRLASELGLGERFRIHPGTADVAPWLAAIDIFVLPSRSEALSNSLMEAMACGCCAVASRVGGNPELVEPERTGLLFSPGDDRELAAHLDRLAADAALRRSLAANGLERMRTGFSTAAAAGRMQQIYEEALGARS